MCVGGKDSLDRADNVVDNVLDPLGGGWDCGDLGWGCRIRSGNNRQHIESPLPPSGLVAIPPSETRSTPSHAHYPTLIPTNHLPIPHFLTHSTVSHHQNPISDRPTTVPLLASSPRESRLNHTPNKDHWILTRFVFAIVLQTINFLTIPGSFRPFCSDSASMPHPSVGISKDIIPHSPRKFLPIRTRRP